MNPFIIFIIFIPILSFILLLVNFIFAPHKPYREKKTPFECGYHSFLAQNRNQFTISFFVFAILFLIFDLEIVIIYPFTVSSYFNIKYGIYVITIFILIVGVGFVYEVGYGALKIKTKQENYLQLEFRNESLGFINKSLTSCTINTNLQPWNNCVSVTGYHFSHISLKSSLLSSLSIDIVNDDILIKLPFTHSDILSYMNAPVNRCLSVVCGCMDNLIYPNIGNHSSYSDLSMVNYDKCEPKTPRLLTHNYLVNYGSQTCDLKQKFALYIKPMVYSNSFYFISVIMSRKYMVLPCVILSSLLLHKRLASYINKITKTPYVFYMRFLLSKIKSYCHVCESTGNNNVISDIITYYRTQTNCRIPYFNSRRNLRGSGGAGGGGDDGDDRQNPRSPVYNWVRYMARFIFLLFIIRYFHLLLVFCIFYVAYENNGIFDSQVLDCLRHQVNVLQIDLRNVLEFCRGFDINIEADTGRTHMADPVGYMAPRLNDLSDYLNAANLSITNNDENFTMRHPWGIPMNGQFFTNDLYTSYINIYLSTQIQDQNLSNTFDGYLNHLNDNYTIIISPMAAPYSNNFPIRLSFLVAISQNDFYYTLFFG